MDNVDKETLKDAAQIMTTEHFTLQTARSATISDSSGRANLFLSTVSTGLVALAFIGQVDELGNAFFIFAMVLLPSFLFLGVVTFARVLESAIEDTIYARGINRIRRFYLDLAPQIAPYLIMSANDDQQGVLQNMGVRPGRWQQFLTTSSMVAVLNSVLAGVLVGLVGNRLNAVLAVLANPIVVPIVGGIVAFIVTVWLHFRYQTVQWRAMEQRMTVRFPSEA